MPDGWRKRRLRFDASLNPKKSNMQLSEETEISFVPMEAVAEHGGLDLSETRELSEVYEGYTYFADNDVCIAKITPCFENGKGALAEGLTNGVGFGTTELHIVRAHSTVVNKFLFYATIAHDFRGHGTSKMLGAGGQKRVPENFIKDWQLALPNVDTQQRIVRFLDEKTAQLDALINKKRELLDQLADRRQALITNAVTKGLDSSAPLIDSGIDWLGDIPAHWDVMPVKRIAKLESGHTPDKKVDAYWEDGDIPWVSLNDTVALRSSDYISDTKFKTNEQGIANSSARILPKAAVVFTRDATIGESAITTRRMAVSQHIIAWLCDENRITPEYLLFLIYGMRGELLRLTNGATIGTIGLGDVKSIQVSLPAIDEQSEIVRFVFDRKAEISAVEDQVGVSIRRLAEYRSALVTGAVTGNITV